MGSLLIVDDEDILRHGLKAMIEDFNLDIAPVYEAGNGLEALDIACAKTPDIILLDIQMPLMDGIGFLEKLREQGINSQVIVLSGHSEFEYAQKAIRFKVFEYLLKPVKRDELKSLLQSILENPVQSLKSDDRMEINENIFSGDNTNIMGFAGIRTPFSQILAKSGIGFPYKCFFSVYIEAIKHFKTSREENADSPTTVIQAHFPHVLFIWDKSGRVMAVVNVQVPDESIKPLMYSIYQSLHNNNYGVAMGVSRVKEDADNIPQLFREAKTAFLQRILQNANHPFFYDEITFPKNEITVNDLLVTKLITMIEIRDQKSAEELVGQIYNEGCLGGEKTIKNLQNSYGSVLLRVASHFVGVTRAAEFIPEKLNFFFAQLLDCKDIKGANKVLAACLFDIGTQSDRKDDNYSGRKSIFLAKQFILDNFDKDINLGVISSHVAMNPAYFSVLFKKAEGVSLTDFIINARIGKAKEYLANPQYKIYTVAEMTGFKDVKYFSKVFKKTVGVTPAEFKEKCMITD